MRISRDTPCYYLTSVTKDRLQVFRTDIVKQIVCESWNRARQSGRIRIIAYVIMPDHTHIITDNARSISDALRFTNGITANKIIKYLKEKEYTNSLVKLREQVKEKNHKYSLWQHHPNAFSINGEDTLMQKVNYIHQNPVRAGLVERAEDYRFSSARLWRGNPLDDEPFITDHKQIDWRHSRED